MKLRTALAVNLLSLDLHPQGTDKGTNHWYIENLYEPIFESGQQINVVYEIGVMYGASLAAWKTILPQARIVGYDVEQKPLHPKAQILFDKNEIEIRWEDAYSITSILGNREEIDLIIDDGPHTLESQIAALKWLSRLSDKGTLIIEDIDGGIISIRKILKFVPNELLDKCIFFTMSHKSCRWDDTVLVITKSEKIFNVLGEKQKYFYFWGMKSRYSWLIYRILDKVLVVINLRNKK